MFIYDPVRHESLPSLVKLYASVLMRGCITREHTDKSQASGKDL
jgi:hypothetical protein